MATTTQTNTVIRTAAPPIAWGRWPKRLLAIVLVALGLGLLGSELDVLPAQWARTVAVGGPAALMAVGAGLAVRGWTSRTRSLPAFAVERGGVECGELLAITGRADLQLRAFAGSSQLAVGQFTTLGGPRVDVRGTAARLTFDGRGASTDAASGPWSVAVAKGLPWDLDLRSGGGHFDLNLQDLTIASMRLQSAYGCAAVTLPAQGPADLQLRLALGDLLVSVPEGVEVKLRLVVGPLVAVSVDERRFINVANGEWMTPLYPTTTQRCTVLVDMSAGDLRIN